MKCKNCASPISIGDKICSNCNIELYSEATRAQECFLVDIRTEKYNSKGIVKDRYVFSEKQTSYHSADTSDIRKFTPDDATEHIRRAWYCNNNIWFLCEDLILRSISTKSTTGSAYKTYPDIHFPCDSLHMIGLNCNIFYFWTKGFYSHAYCNSSPPEPSILYTMDLNTKKPLIKKIDLPVFDPSYPTLFIDKIYNYNAFSYHLCKSDFYVQPYKSTSDIQPYFFYDNGNVSPIITSEESTQILAEIVHSVQEEEYKYAHNLRMYRSSYMQEEDPLIKDGSLYYNFAQNYDPLTHVSEIHFMKTRHTFRSLEKSNQFTVHNVYEYHHLLKLVKKCDTSDLLPHQANYTFSFIEGNDWDTLTFFNPTEIATSIAEYFRYFDYYYNRQPVRTHDNISISYVIVQKNQDNINTKIFTSLESSPFVWDSTSCLISHKSCKDIRNHSVTLADYIQKNKPTDDNKKELLKQNQQFFIRTISLAHWDSCGLKDGVNYKKKNVTILTNYSEITNAPMYMSYTYDSSEVYGACIDLANRTIYLDETAPIKPITTSEKNIPDTWLARPLSNYVKYARVTLLKRHKLYYQKNKILTSHQDLFDDFNVTMSTYLNYCSLVKSNKHQVFEASTANDILEVIGLIKHPYPKSTIGAMLVMNLKEYGFEQLQLVLFKKNQNTISIKKCDYLHWSDATNRMQEFMKLENLPEWTVPTIPTSKELLKICIEPVSAKAVTTYTHHCECKMLSAQKQLNQYNLDFDTSKHSRGYGSTGRQLSWEGDDGFGTSYSESRKNKTALSCIPEPFAITADIYGHKKEILECHCFSISDIGFAYAHYGQIIFMNNVPTINTSLDYISNMFIVQGYLFVWGGISKPSHINYNCERMTYLSAYDYLHVNINPQMKVYNLTTGKCIHSKEQNVTIITNITIDKSYTSTPTARIQFGESLSNSYNPYQNTPAKERRVQWTDEGLQSL